MLSPPPVSCQYSISLYDTFGDGWNGCKLDVLADGMVLLDDITLAGGYGPATFYFPVSTGAQVTTVFTPGSYACEPYYYIFDAEGNQVYYAPANCNPVVSPGQLYGSCPQFGTVEGYVFNHDGLAIAGATIGVQNGAVINSGPDGHYLLFPVNAGNTEISCGKAGYNTVTDIVTVMVGDTVSYDFTLTQPNMVVYPLTIEQTLNPNEFYTTSLNILNNGSGQLNWSSTINYISQPVLSCQYAISLYDTYGDGWNGGTLDVLVNGEVILDNITLSNGSGPATYYFDLTSDDEITTEFTAGSWANEPYYRVFNSQGTEVWYSPPASNGPPDILPGQLVAACGGSGWLTMDYNNGTVQPFGGVDNIPTHLDASNTNTGEVYSAEIVITSTPNVGTISVPVTMIVMGSQLVPPENLEAELSDEVSGAVNLTWEWEGDSFQFFMIRRDGVIVGTTTSNTFTELLPDYGTYCYTVQAVYDEGYTAPAGPECIEWPNPDIFVNPTDIHGWVWVGNTVDVYTSIYNNGEGMLAYSFPEFAALDLISDPDIQHNQAGVPDGLRCIAPGKGDESANSQGYPVVLGAGGPDGFGYVWIDSDESGGPAFNWTDISTTGAVINGLSDDNIVGPFSIGFDFPFYGEDKSQFWVNSNGTVGFTSTYITLGNTGIPTVNSTYKDFIAWMWDDLVFRSGQSMVYYRTFSDKTIIQFDNYGRYGQTGGIWAQVIIYQSGKVMLMYEQLDAALTYTSCTVGMQSPDPATGLQVVYNNNYLHNDLAVMFSLPADFIVDVQPASGTVASGDSVAIAITYDSEGYDPGEYTEDLVLESNDDDTPEWIISNTMHVYLPAQFAGTVKDNDNGEGLPGVTVTAGEFNAETDDNGHYSLQVDEGEFDVVFSRPGYIDTTVEDTAALAGQVTPIDIGLWDENYPPSFVNAEVQDNDTWCKVQWTLPQGPYEISMDDGEADDFFLFAHSGSWHAVKFTPPGYPATVIGGKFYVGDGEFPGPFLGTEFGVAVFDDDGPNGLPGTMLDSAGVTVNNYGWVSLDWMNASFGDGSFYLAMYQSGNAPDAAPIGVDLDNPVYFRSYTKFLDNSWTLSAFQDFMIRAWVTGPESDNILSDAGSNSWKATPRVPQGWTKYAMTKSGSLPRILPGNERNDRQIRAVEGMSNRNVQNYMVARYSEFDPNGDPENGVLTELASTGSLQYNDDEWEALPQGWYAYGVKALYTSGLYSDYAVSNVVGHRMDCQVTVHCTLTTGLEPSGVEITLQGLDWPYDTYHAVTPASGQVIFPAVWKGQYDATAYKIGYDTYFIDNDLIDSDKTFDIILSEKKYPPTCLYVDPLTLQATWCKPLMTALGENFDSPEFPPPGWQMTTEGRGWFRTDDGSTGGWTVPAWDSYYACVNDAASSSMPGCCDYLITPPLDLRESEGYALSFDSYYDGNYGQLAFLEYSLDGGATWEYLAQLNPADEWVHLDYDLSQFSGPDGPAPLWLAFHADDAGIWASGWAVDNPIVQVPSPAANYLDYYVFLDDALEGTTLESNWNYAPLVYGKEYVASVAAQYSSGLSARDYYRFVCKYLFPPRNLAGVAPDNAVILIWDPPVSVPIPIDGNSYEDYLSINGLSNGNSTDKPSSSLAPGANVSLPQVDPFDGLRDLDSKAWACDALANNMVTFTLGNPGMLNLLGPGASDFISAADIVNGVYYGIVYGGTFTIMDTASGEFIIVGTTVDLTGLAYDYTTDVMYGVDFGGSVYTIDLETGVATSIGNTGGVLIDCACDNDGHLYAVDIGSDEFGWIDKSTGQWTPIANLPFDANYAQGMQCDHESNTIYHAAYNNSIGAGQLYMVDQATGTYTLIGNFQGNTEVDGFAMAFNPGSGGELPDNLLGYNIYKDDEFIAYQDQVGGMEPQSYIVGELDPGYYNFHVTAVYDLATYGYPGETGESKADGPASVSVDYCFDLDFLETWDLGNFNANQWQAEGTNWTINGQAGNPGPSAEFTWDPLLTDYQQSLESYPLCATGMTEGKIWLDYDVKLEAFEATGEEFLRAEVWNWETRTWSTVATYSNENGGFAWTSEHLNIRPEAMGLVFKVRFTASGSNSLNILGWFVDNIHVYRTCDGPTDLTASYNGETGCIELNWGDPQGGSIDEWIHWDDGTNYDAIGTGGSAEFDVAARWDAEMLMPYDGAILTQVAFFPTDAATTYRIRVWLGAGAVNMVVDQPVQDLFIGEWNYITLDTPVPIDLNNELWVGYNIKTLGGYLAGTDDGPAIDGYGNMINFNGWQTLLEINPDLDYNWNIQAHVQTITGAAMPIANPSGSRELMGFNIYYSIDGGEYQLIDYTSSVYYSLCDPQSQVLYCFMVSAVYESETDQCESALSNEACLVLYEDIADPGSLSGNITIYPNPANDRVFVTTKSEIQRITLYDATGRLLLDEMAGGQDFELSTAAYAAGVYMIRVGTLSGISTRTMTIHH